MNALLLTLAVLGGGHCVVQQQQAYVVQPYVVNYFVGQQVREQALVQKALQDDPDWAEFKKFKEWRAYSKASTQNVEATPQTVFQQRCVKCHTGAKPGGGISFETKALSAELMRAAMKQVSAGKMPKGTKLTPEEAGQLFQELLEMSPDVPATPPPPSPEVGELK